MTGGKEEGECGAFAHGYVNVARDQHNEGMISHKRSAASTLCRLRINKKMTRRGKKMAATHM